MKIATWGDGETATGDDGIYLFTQLWTISQGI